MSKIIKEQEHADYSVRTVFTKDLGMFKLKEQFIVVLATMAMVHVKMI